jgi:YD repeat-containing protein
MVLGVSSPALAADTVAPKVTAVTPLANATGVPVTVKPTATFNEAVNTGSMRYSFIRASNGASAAGSYAYDAASRTFTFSPRTALVLNVKYTVTVSVKDAAGNMSAPKAWSFSTGVTPDTSSPTAPGTPAVANVTTVTADVAWAPSTDNVGVSSYDVFNGSTVLTSVSGSTPSASLVGLAPTTNYSIAVVAVDAAGNRSPASPVTAFQTTTPPPPVDVQAPTAPGTPTVGVLTATSAVLSWTPATDNVAVAAYQVSGGPTVLTAATPDITLTGLSPVTSYTITVKALDAAGNVSVASGARVFNTPATPLPRSRSGAGIPGSTGKTLVVYDSTGPYAFLGEQYATLTANLTSHFGDWTALPAVNYAAGEMASYAAVVYVGSTYDEPLPVAFLDDVTATTKPVIWMYDNIWQLTARDPNFGATHGFTWTGFDFAAVSTVNYEGKTFTRDPQNGAGIMGTSISDPAKATPIGTAVRADGSTLPWGVTSGNFTYVGEIPFAYMTMDDRYVAFSDLLIDVLAPATAVRHRALVRIEDVGPDATPSELRHTTDYLYSKNVPFTVAVYPRYRDPNGVSSGGVAEDYALADRPQVVAELKYMQSHGGTLLMHGYTHQYSNVANPYNGVSADDFEFYAAHVDAANSVIYDGPVAVDSQAWAQGRISDSFTAFAAAGLTTPTIFEFPHYAGSDADNKAVGATFQKRYDRGLYSSGSLRGGPIDNTKIVGQFFPYTVRDIYGVVVVPENIGNIELEMVNNHPPHLPADIIKSAQLNTAVRDGVASFFYHPYLDEQVGSPNTALLKTTVEGIQAAGYTFVAASAM